MTSAAAAVAAGGTTRRSPARTASTAVVTAARRVGGRVGGDVRAGVTSGIGGPPHDVSANRRSVTAVTAIRQWAANNFGRPLDARIVSANTLAVVPVTSAWRPGPSRTQMFITHRRPAAALTAAAVLAAGLARHHCCDPRGVRRRRTTSAGPTPSTAPPLDERWSVVNPDPAHVSVSGGALRIAGQPGDTYQAVNTAKNIVVLDVPAGDFTATADVSAAVAKVYQGAGLIAWQDMDNYVRSGLTFVGSLSPSGTRDRDRRRERRDLQRRQLRRPPGLERRAPAPRPRRRHPHLAATGTAPRGSPPARPTSPSTPRRSASTPSPRRTAPSSRPPSTPSPSSTSAGADVTPAGPFVLQADGDAPFLVADERRAAPDRRAADREPAPAGHRRSVTAPSPWPPTPARSCLRDGALVARRRGRRARRPLRLTDAGGGKVVLRVAADPAAYVAAPGEAARSSPAPRRDAVRFALSEVDDGTSTLSIDGDGTGASISDDDVRHLLRGHQLRRRRWALRRAGAQPVLRVQHLRQRLLHRPDRLAGARPQRRRHHRHGRRRRHPAQRR